MTTAFMIHNMATQTTAKLTPNLIMEVNMEWLTITKVLLQMPLSLEAGSNKEYLQNILIMDLRLTVQDIEIDINTLFLCM